jgi:simple sugar transport system substrate-binding protein
MTAPTKRKAKWGIGVLALAAGAAALLVAATASATADEQTVAGQKKITIAVITHGSGDSFWAVAKRGALQAGKDLGITVRYSESANDPKRQAQLVDAAVAQKVNGIATSLPNAAAMKDSLARARKAGIPIYTLNSGLNDYKKLGAISHVGQTETIAGQGAGANFKAAGAKKLLCVIHEQANIGLNQRCAGAKSGFKGTVVNLQVAGIADIQTTKNQIQAKLQADKSIDAVLSLNPDIAVAAMDAIAGARSKAKLATFDLSGDVISAIKSGKMLFAVDQQQYLQGYLPVVFLYLYNTNLNTVGGGLPVLTGPGFVVKANASKVEALAKRGTR